MFGAYDVFVLAALVVGYLVGRSRGFLLQLSGILTLALGYVAATVLSGPVAGLFPEDWSLDVRRFAAWSLIYAVVSTAVYLVFRWLSNKAKERDLEELDRRFGGALGTVKAAGIVLLLTLVGIVLSASARNAVRGSVSGRAIARFGLGVKSVLPDRIGEAVGQCLESVAPEASGTIAAPAPAPAPAPTPQPRPLPVVPRPVDAGSPIADPGPTRRPRKPPATKPIPSTPKPVEPTEPATEPVPPEPRPPVSDDPDADEPDMHPEPQDPLAPPKR